jgi:hypothetical protein
MCACRLPSRTRGDKVPNQARLKQLAQGFLGVNLRKDRVSLADEELAKTINADLHERPGVILLRKGRRKLFTTALADLSIRRLALVNGVRYAVAGQSVYRDQVKIIDGLLSAELFTTMVAAEPLSDETTWVFIADRGLMRKDNGSSVAPWGIDVPPIPVAYVGAMGSGLTGDYQAGYTQIRHSGDAVAAESNLAQAEDTITLAAGRLAISDIPEPDDDQVTGIGIYRTVAGGTLFLLDSRLLFPTTSTTFAITHGWEVCASPQSVEPSGLQHQWSIDKGTRRASQQWEPETGEGLRFIDGAAANAESSSSCSPSGITMPRLLQCRLDGPPGARGQVVTAVRASAAIRSLRPRARLAGHGLAPRTLSATSIAARRPRPRSGDQGTTADRGPASPIRP